MSAAAATSPVTITVSSGGAAQTTAQTPLLSSRPYIGLVGVLLGAMMSTLGSRTTTFGLSDLRGGLHVGFDEGAWITTSFGVGQMLIGVASPYLGAIFGVRRILLMGIIVFFMTSLLAPLSPNLNAFLLMQFLGGVGSGTFIPLTVSYILRNLPKGLVIYGISIYAMNSELSQNVAASLEGWYTDNLSWHWIDWQYCIALPIMYFCIWYGMPVESGLSRRLRDLDWPGIFYAGAGFGLLYAALDQGNRLDWLNSGLIVGLLVGGGLLTALFIARELISPSPFVNIRVIVKENLIPLFLLLAGFRFIILSTAYIIPSYLQTVQNFRELQVGSVLLWIALPQFAIVLPLGWVLNRFDGRYVLALGNLMIGIACLMGTGLTSEWATEDFLPSQILQALGQSFALTSLIVLVIKSISPADALTIGSLLQMTRLFGGEIGTSFMQTFVRVREQIHSNLIGLHVDGSTVMTVDRLTTYQNVLGEHSADHAVTAGRATKLLGTAVAQQAAVYSYIDGFFAAAIGSAICLFLVALVQKPKNPVF
ncbi:MFS transporter [Hyphomicrobium sp.]|jgi:DHA2 family multidrug resistance protein|uniref:MFS transporter n=1 Tax=Hyphomicrobium sp. TaxID=82 RepID=UPI00356A7493